jgi:glycosyltransferase involved in cell wall biosynthesis
VNELTSDNGKRVIERGPTERLRRVTPLILTYNEAPNIARTLDSLHWAERVVIVDSGSTDDTEQLAKSYPNVSWHVRAFDCHLKQWQYGISETNIGTDYILALDADMLVPEMFVRELGDKFLSHDFKGGIVPFKYLMMGRALSGSVLTAQLRIFNRREVEVGQEGHTQQFRVGNNVYRFKAPLLHDDRKPLERWITSQLSYSRLEAEKLLSGTSTRWRDQVRCFGLMPPLAAALAYIRAGGPFGGKAAARYAYERATYECLLAIRLQSESRKDEG